MISGDVLPIAAVRILVVSIDGKPHTLDAKSIGFAITENITIIITITTFVASTGVPVFGEVLTCTILTEGIRVVGIILNKGCSIDTVIYGAFKLIDTHFFGFGGHAVEQMAHIFTVYPEEFIFGDGTNGLNIRIVTAIGHFVVGAVDELNVFLIGEVQSGRGHAVRSKESGKGRRFVGLESCDDSGRFSGIANFV